MKIEINGIGFVLIFIALVLLFISVSIKYITNEQRKEITDLKNKNSNLKAQVEYLLSCKIGN